MPSLLQTLCLLCVPLLAFACSIDEDCQLNGVCSAGACACRPGWTGTDCGRLDLLPAPLQHAFYRPTVASWGGAITPEAGTYYMFFALIEGHCGLNAWQPNSAIYRAVSSTGSPAGPYINESLILPYFTHNPSVSRHPDGSLLVWHIGSGGGGSNFVTGCANGTTPPPPPPPPVRFRAAGGCLAPSGAYPCWQGGSGGAYLTCPLVVGDCASPAAQWSLEGSSWVSHAYPGASINIDCNSCLPGAGAKLFNSGASPLAYNASAGQISMPSCPGMCLSAGAAGARALCGGGSEPWLPTQVHVAPCSSSDTAGWQREQLGEAAAAAQAQVQRSAPPLAGAPAAAAWPQPLTDVNAAVSSRGVAGPFTDSGIFQGPRQACFPWESDNPAPLVLANGSVWVMYRSWNPAGGKNCTTPIGLARSTGASWNSTYEHSRQALPSGFVNDTSQRYVPLEDPYLYQDAVGHFHALFHSMGGCSDVGCHAFSRDGHAWHLASSNPYTTTIGFEDGSSRLYARRERPHLVFNAQGDPAFLSNGVQETWQVDHSYTLVQPINVPFP